MALCARLLPALIAALAAPACARGAEAPAGPDIVLVLVDTLRADRLPFYGYAGDTAPFLASWAARSVVFEHAWSASSWTAPSTASLFTGTYPSQHGVTLGMRVFDKRKDAQPELELNRVPEALETIPEFLRAHGYRTFGAADNPNIGAVMGFDDGFERFSGTPNEGSERILAKLAEWKDELRAAHPRFVYLHFMEPHVPYLEHAPWYHAPASGGEIAHDSAAYDSEIRYVDGQIERAFEALGVDDDTLVVFVADHGEEFGDHGGRFHEPKLYSELMHVPFFVRLPGVVPRRVRENVSLVDVLPTLRALVGAPPAPQDAGVSLLELVRANVALAPRALFAMRQTGHGVRQAVVVGDDKYIVLDPSDPKQPQRAELYDLAHDAGEKQNLVGPRAELAHELDARLRAFRAAAPHWSQSVRFAPDEELQRTLKSLGYGGEGGAGEKEDGKDDAKDK